MMWLTSDWHFGHANLLTFDPPRPFASIEEHDAELIRRHNAVVTPEDEVLVLGDVAMGNIAESLPKCAQMNGRKVLVCGNHDRPVMKPAKAARWITRYQTEGGFKEVWVDPPEPDELVPGLIVAVSHYPYYGDSSDADRFVERRPVDEGLWLLHGHVHHAWKVRDRMINVGVDVWDYAPVSAETLAEVIRSSHRYRGEWVGPHRYFTTDNEVDGFMSPPWTKAEHA